MSMCSNFAASAPAGGKLKVIDIYICLACENLCGECNPIEFVLRNAGKLFKPLLNGLHAVYYS